MLLGKCLGSSKASFPRLYAHGAILAALLQRKETGCGQKIDCNLLSTQVDKIIGDTRAVLSYYR
jgi:crotonobetainyl-CoA:carnitine CoA-transferase CaiB-like acyl-CoA transferase